MLHLTDALNRQKILTGLLGKKRRSSDSQAENAPTNSYELLPLKRVRGLASLSEYTEHRAEECLAAPAGTAFNAAEVVEMVGLSRAGDGLLEQLSATKEALNSAGATLPIVQRRIWAKELVSVLKVIKAVDMGELAELPQSADTGEIDEQLSHALVGKAKTVELLSSAIDAHLRTMWGAHLSLIHI